MENEIKPVKCGCGGEAEVYQDAYNYFVACNNCGTQTVWYDTQEEAIETWNTAMGKPIDFDRFDKDTNVPNKFATDTNVGDKTAKFKQDGEFLRCGKCNHIVDSGYKYCPECGSRLEFK